MNLAEQFDQATRGRNLPVEGVSIMGGNKANEPDIVTREDGIRVRVHFLPEATQQDKEKAFDFVMKLKLKDKED